MQVCPYHSIELLDIAQGYSNGTSYIDAHERGCYLCDLFPCVLACPSGALDHATTQISDVKMGVGVLREHEACLAYKNENVNLSGVTKMLERKIYNDREQAVKDAVQNSVDKPCDLCVSLCPVGDAAITMAKSDGRNLPEFKQGCVGCGVCAEVCPAQIIDIAPNRGYDEIYKG